MVDERQENGDESAQGPTHGVTRGPDHGKHQEVPQERCQHGDYVEGPFGDHLHVGSLMCQHPRFDNFLSVSYGVDHGRSQCHHCINRHSIESLPSLYDDVMSTSQEDRLLMIIRMAMDCCKNGPIMHASQVCSILSDFKKLVHNDLFKSDLHDYG